MTLNDIQGEIPSEIGQLVQLRGKGEDYIEDDPIAHLPKPHTCSYSFTDRIDLSYNELTGTVPSEVGGLTKMSKSYKVGMMRRKRPTCLLKPYPMSMPSQNIYCCIQTIFLVPSRRKSPHSTDSVSPTIAICIFEDALSVIRGF